jgi:hypothetical protein
VRNDPGRQHCPQVVLAERPGIPTQGFTGCALYRVAGYPGSVAFASGLRGSGPGHVYRKADAGRERVTSGWGSGVKSMRSQSARKPGSPGLKPHLRRFGDGCRHLISFRLTFGKRRSLRLVKAGAGGRFPSATPASRMPSPCPRPVGRFCAARYPPVYLRITVKNRLRAFRQVGFRVGS